LQKNQDNMTRNSLLLLAFICLTTVGCKGKMSTNTESNSDTTTVDSVVSNEQNRPNESDTVVVRSYEFTESDKYAEIRVNACIPYGTDAATVAMRKSLLSIIDKSFGYDWEGNRIAPAYKDGYDDVDKYTHYYISAHLKTMSAESKTFNTENETDEIMKSEDELNIVKSYETPSLIDFTISGSTYISGAAHPSNFAYSVFFNKQNGKKMEQLFIKGAEKKMQKILVKGVTRYFKECGEDCNEETVWDCLLLENNNKFIPLPQNTPSPTKDGLCFTYGQYEIASYAAGMPSFIIPYNDTKPYLTEETKQLLGL